MKTIRVISTPKQHSTALRFETVYLSTGNKKRHKALNIGFAAFVPRAGIEPA